MLNSTANLTPKQNPTDNSVFTNALARGIDQTQLLAFAFADTLGKLAGIDLLSTIGRAGVERNLKQIAANPAKLQKFDDIHSLSSFADFFIDNTKNILGKQLPNLLAILLPALGASGIAARVVGQDVILSQVEKAALGKVLKRQVGQKGFAGFTRRKVAAITGKAVTQGERLQSAKRIAANAAGFAAGTVLNAGETSLNFDQLSSTQFLERVKNQLKKQGIRFIVRTTE